MVNFEVRVRVKNNVGLSFQSFELWHLATALLYRYALAKPARSRLVSV